VSTYFSVRQLSDDEFVVFCNHGAKVSFEFIRVQFPGAGNLEDGFEFGGIAGDCYKGSQISEKIAPTLALASRRQCLRPMGSFGCRLGCTIGLPKPCKAHLLVEAASA